MFKEVDILSADRVFAYVLFILSLLVPGVSYYYVTQPAMFLTMDLSKLILASVILSMPIFFLSFYIVLRGEAIEKNSRAPFVEMMIGIATYTMVCFFLGMGLHYAGSYFLKPNVEMFVYVYAVLSLMVIVTEISRFISHRKDNPKPIKEKPKKEEKKKVKKEKSEEKKEEHKDSEDKKKEKKKDDDEKIEKKSEE